MAQGNLPSSHGGVTTSSTVTVPLDATANTSDNGSTTSSIRSTGDGIGATTESPVLKWPETPPRLSHTDDNDSISPTTRTRLSSRDYTHSYEGHYGQGNADMAGIDIARTSGQWWEDQQWLMFAAYIIVLLLVFLVVTMILSMFEDENNSIALSGTVTNIVHFFVTLIYLHWLKGGYFDNQGELDHLTLWEQIEATPGTNGLRLALRITPTLLCYFACIEAGWKEAPFVCTMNVIVWYLTLLGKMPFMNGVRLFGINAHPNIDQPIE